MGFFLNFLNHLLIQGNSEFASHALFFADCTVYKTLHIIFYSKKITLLEFLSKILSECLNKLEQICIKYIHCSERRKKMSEVFFI